MAQITEDYVSFETAKLLKEKEFDEPCYAYWHEDENRLIVSQSMHAIRNITNPCFFGPAAPTLQMAMKWLREVHKLVICAEIGNENFKGSTNYSNPDRWYWFFDITNEKGVVIDTESDFILNEYATYEEACEAAIKYCLENLI